MRSLWMLGISGGLLPSPSALLVYARQFFDRLPIHSRFAELIPSGSALFITVLGIGMTVQALAQIGYL